MAWDTQTQKQIQTFYANWVRKLEQALREVDIFSPDSNERRKAQKLKADLDKAWEIYQDVLSQARVAGKSSLRSRLIRLAHERPELRPRLLPLLAKQAAVPRGVQQAAESGLFEFWRTVASMFPQIKTGDVPPGASQVRKLERAAEEAISAWIDWNA